MRERERIHHRHRSKPPCHCRRSPNHHAITTNLQSLLPILISNPRQSKRPTTKIQSKPKPTSNVRENRSERKRENPPSPSLQTTTQSLSISNRRAPTRRWLASTGSPWGSLSLGKTSLLIFYFFFFLLNFFFFNTTQVYTIKKI